MFSIFQRPSHAICLDKIFVPLRRISTYNSEYSALVISLNFSLFFLLISLNNMRVLQVDLLTEN